MLFTSLIGFGQNHSAELISQETSISIDKNRLTKEYYYEIKINNRAGEKHADISIPYTKMDKLSNVEAYIKDSDGKVVKRLRKNAIVERSLISSFSFYEDNLIKEFTLKHNTYPYTIVYSYRIQQREFLHIHNWIPIIARNVPTLSARLNLSVPKDYSINYTSKMVDDPSIKSEGDKNIYQWNMRYTDILKPEVHSPLLVSLLPSVLITPKEFIYERNGSFKDWISYGNWQYDLLQGLNELPDYEIRRIHELIEGVEEDREKINILYHYLQDETRYINISIETGGMMPYPACYVSNNKYGDCKALTNYFKAILDHLEIPSYYTKVYAGDRIKEINKNFPAQQFNHAILYIPQEGEEDIWLDCTSSSAFDYLGTFTQNREVFVVDHNNSHFVKTPSLNPTEVLETRTIEVSYHPETASAKFTNSYKGDSYETISQIERGYNESQKSRIMRNYIVTDGFQLVDYELAKPNRDALEVVLNYEATSRDLYKHYGEEILIGNVRFSLPEFEKPEVRKLPIQIDYPIHQMDTITYEIPSGYLLHKSPGRYSIESKYGKYNLHFYEKDGEITLVKSLLITAGEYPISEYAEFYDFYLKILGLESKTHISLYKE